MDKNEVMLAYSMLDNKTLKIEFVKPCGHHMDGEIAEYPFAAASQYIASGFAEPYFDADYLDKED